VVELTASDTFTPTAIVGVKFYAEEPGLEVGLSYRPPFETSMDGDYKSSIGTEKVKFQINLPAIIRTGFRVKREAWDAELDLTVEDWTTRKADIITVNDGDYAGFDVSDGIVRERNGDVAFRISVGGSYKVSNSLVAHAGILHETAAIPEEKYVLTLPDSPKTGIAAGVSYMFARRYMVSGNFTYLDLAKVDITNSEVNQGGIGIDDQYRSIISNGTYDGYYAMMGLSFGARF
jgi:long-subunit fatty acid transport protein